jgi:cyclophilin family peptidyl-prolyl cis-trans isomerase
MKSPLSSFSGTTSAGSRIGRVSGTAPDDFADLIGQWLAIDEQMDVITQQARSATMRDQEVLRPKYLQLVNQAHELLPSLRMATLREYRDRPNQNPEVTMLMLGILAHHVRSDQIDDAMQVASMLLDAECDHLALPNLAGRAAYCAHDFDSAELLLTRAKELNAIEKVAEDYLRDVDVVRSRWNVELQVRQREERDDNLPRVLLETTKGNITLELFENEAPQTVGNFVHLVDSGFYNGLTFHRVVANFMGQSGCPKGDGYGGPGYSILDEVGRVGHRNHFSGSLSMAKTKDPNSAGSQFFITFRPVPELDGKHTVFGRVIDGMPVLAELQRREANSRIEPDRILRAEVLRKQDHAYVPTKTRQGS